CTAAAPAASARVSPSLTLVNGTAPSGAGPLRNTLPSRSTRDVSPPSSSTPTASCAVILIVTVLGQPRETVTFFTHGVGATFLATCSVSSRSMLLCWPPPLASLICCTSAFSAPWTSTFLTVSTGKKKSTAHAATTASTATNAHRRRVCL